MVEAKRVAAILGGAVLLGKNVQTELDMADLVAAGIPAKAVDAMVAAKVLTAEEAGSIAARSTLARRRSRNDLLSPEESDRAERMARAHALALDVLGNAEKARSWLRRPNRAMSGRRPIELVFTDPGLRLVEATLGRLAHGVYS